MALTEFTTLITRYTAAMDLDGRVDVIREAGACAVRVEGGGKWVRCGQRRTTNVVLAGQRNGSRQAHPR